MQRVAIVTGGATGIGRALSETLAADGYAVVVGYFGNADGASDTARAIEAAGGSVRLVRGDLGRVETAVELVDAAVTGFGRLDVMCCHAGLTVFERFVEATPASFDRVVATNLRGTFFAAQAAARKMIEQGDGGRIVLTSSVTARRAVDGTAAYGMTKAGIEGLARTLAVELASAGITVNAVAPGSIVNDRNLADDPGYAERWAAVNPVGRVGIADDVVAAVRFLVGPGAGFLTGQTIVVDGGWTAAGRTPDDVVRLAGEIDRRG
jgi:NAD(P)-dependent dehydrogenase (short-subunit alcohol dehydrogenase family)